jgi:hypothetical protein
MSAYLYLDRPEDDVADVVVWEPSKGLLGWVLSFLADHVEDEEMAAQFKQRSNKSVSIVALSSYTDDQVRDIVRVIRELVPAGAEAAFPPPDEYGGAEALRELVDMVTKWGQAKGF